MKNLSFSPKLLESIYYAYRAFSNDEMQASVKDWIASCVKEAAPGDILLIYNRTYHGLCPRWEDTLAAKFDLRSDEINGQKYYRDRELLNQICRELDRWVRAHPEEAKKHFLAASQVGLCINCPGEFKFSEKRV